MCLLMYYEAMMIFIYLGTNLLFGWRIGKGWVIIHRVCRGKYLRRLSHFTFFYLFVGCWLWLFWLLIPFRSNLWLFFCWCQCWNPWRYLIVGVVVQDIIDWSFILILVKYLIDWTSARRSYINQINYKLS